MTPYTQEELITLTGYKQPARQRRILKEIGLPYHVNAQGRNIVMRGTVEHRVIGAV